MKVVRLLMLIFVCCAGSLRAQSPDESYVRIYQVIQEADRLNDAGQKKAAAAKYLEAQDGLQKFQGIFPGWNDRVIKYRLNYVSTKLAPLAAVIAPPVPATNAPALSTESAASMILTNAPSVPVPVPAPAPMPTPAPAPSIPVPAPAPGPSPEIQRELAALKAEVERLKAENSQLGARLKEALSVQPAAIDPRELAKAGERIRFLEKENDLLKVRLRVVTSTPPTTSPAGESVSDLKTKLTQQADIVAALRAENEVLKRQRDVVVAMPPPGTPSDTADLLNSLTARVATLEAKPVPYTPEELALMSKPGAIVSSPDALVASSQAPPAEGPVRKPSKQVPPGAGPLVAAAEKAFAVRNYAEAERKYLDVLRQDENNVSTLGNLASTQLELGRVAEAEKSVRQALALDGTDYFSLYVLGRIRFHQEKLDEAIDALSRSARANPEYAETQNYLGIALSEKGLRIPAEAALRRAVQIQPNHAAAHNNLAVVYATQTPPAIALARWHYQKALAAGHQRNPELEKILDERR
ncbi:MAG TPA: tetratricopeptide repeat protein [Candidatus Acidoferrum sp.]|nr:tetratricopeptide repeat protein [Candidatus Acidoferrum sp.]